MILNFIDNIIKLTECVHLNGRPSVSTFNVILDLNGLTELSKMSYVCSHVMKSIILKVNIYRILHLCGSYYNSKRIFCIRCRY